VFQGGCDLGISPLPGGIQEPEKWVELDPSSGWIPSIYGKSPKIQINGNTVYEYRCSHCETTYIAPSLGAELTGGGPFFERILHSLTYSPRASALAPGPAPSVPTSWRRVSFGGVSIAVPQSWPIEFSSSYDDCWTVDDLESPPQVLLDAGTTGFLPTSFGCENNQHGPVFVGAPPEGLLVDPGGYRREGTTGTCSEPNGVQVCIITSDQFGELTLSVAVPGRVLPVAVEIGLAGDGSIARTILHSIRATNAPAT
jgi:hypothetical protein